MFQRCDERSWLLQQNMQSKAHNEKLRRKNYEIDQLKSELNSRDAHMADQRRRLVSLEASAVSSGRRTPSNCASCINYCFLFSGLASIARSESAVGASSFVCTGRTHGTVGVGNASDGSRESDCRVTTFNVLPSLFFVCAFKLHSISPSTTPTRLAMLRYSFCTKYTNDLHLYKRYTCLINYD